MRFVILTHRERLYENEVKRVILPGSDGEFSVWDFHQPFLYRLCGGYIKVIEAPNQSLKSGPAFLIRDGIAKMLGNTLTVLAQG